MAGRTTGHDGNLSIGARCLIGAGVPPTTIPREQDLYSSPE
jgi:hypothetical protein